MSDFRQLLLEMIRELVAEAVQEIKAEPDNQNGTQLPARMLGEKNTVTVEKGVLTEKLLLKLTDQTTTLLKIGKSTILTPLAKDVIRSRGIQIEQSREE